MAIPGSIFFNFSTFLSLPLVLIPYLSIFVTPLIHLNMRISAVRVLSKCAMRNREHFTITATLQRVKLGDIFFGYLIVFHLCPARYDVKEIQYEPDFNIRTIVMSTLLVFAIVCT